MVESCKKTLIDINASIALLRQQIAFDKDIVPYLQLLHKHFSKLEIDKRETRALKWAYSVLIPFQKLTEKLKQGFNLYELADYFDVEVKYMVNCIDFYIGKYGQITV